jgi:DNA-3-methyladenine glycosylase II
VTANRHPGGPPGAPPGRLAVTGPARAKVTGGGHDEPYPDTAVLRDTPGGEPAAARRFTMEVASPFRLDFTVWALRRRAHNAVDRFDGQCFRRTLVVDGQPVEAAVSQQGRDGAPLLAVELRGSGTVLSEDRAAESRRVLERTLGLGADLRGFYQLAELDEALQTLAGRFRGMRPPCFPSVFEAVVNAIACQQLSLTVGIHLLNRLAQSYGLAIPASSRAQPGFPAPRQLAAASPAALRELGFSLAKAHAVTDLARRVATGELDLEALRDVDDDRAMAILLSLTGVGRWSAEYTLLRGLGRYHVLPGDDVGARNNLRRRFGLAAGADYDAVARLSQRWWPYAGLVYFHLLLDALASGGHLPSPAA